MDNQEYAIIEPGSQIGQIIVGEESDVIKDLKKRNSKVTTENATVNGRTIFRSPWIGHSSPGTLPIYMFYFKDTTEMFSSFEADPKRAYEHHLAMVVERERNKITLDTWCCQ